MFRVPGLNSNRISHNATHSLQTSLFANRLYQTSSQILLRMRHRDRSHLCRMDKLMVAAADTLQAPVISLQQLDQFTALHCVYYTHYTMLRPMAALRLSGQSDECLKVAARRRMPRPESDHSVVAKTRVCSPRTATVRTRTSNDQSRTHPTSRHGVPHFSRIGADWPDFCGKFGSSILDHQRIRPFDRPIAIHRAPGYFPGTRSWVRAPRGETAKYLI